MLEVLNATTLRASWQEPQQQNGIITDYRLVLRDLETHSGRVTTTTTTQREFTWSDLHPHYAYRVSIAAATNAGYGPTTEREIQMPEAGMIYVCSISDERNRT